MKALRPLLLLSLVLFLLGVPAAFAGSRLSPHVRVLAKMVENVQNAKPGTDISLPDGFRRSVLNPPVAGVAAAPGAEPVFSLVAVHDGSVMGLRDAGFELGTVTDRTAVLFVPQSRLGELETVPGLVRVEPSFPVELSLDVSGPEIDADTAHGGAQPPYSGWTGAGVVVGVVDTGLDLDHPDFRDGSNNTRLLTLWDQTISGTPPPEYGCNVSRNWCGAEWSSAQINAGSTSQLDVIGHGTHVAGIAAGDGSATGNGRPAYQYVGIAPEADLVIVNSTLATGAIIEGVEYVFTRAGAKPAVVNLSLGSQFGPHDGTAALDMALSDMSGPGRILVAAAGNEGDLDIHAEGTVAGNSSMNFTLNVPAYTPGSGAQNDVIWLESWYDGANNLSFTLTAPNGTHKLGPIARGFDSAIDSPSGALIIDNGTSSPVNGDVEVLMNIFDFTATNFPAAGNWTLTITNNNATPAFVDLWMNQSTLPADPSWTGGSVTRRNMISSPSSADSVLSVAAYATKGSWTVVGGSTFSYNPTPTIGAIAPFSSPGPLRDGRMKPDIAAPGFGIVAAVSTDASTSATWIVRDGVHRINQGTSQAAPHVTGAVALILEAHPTYSYGQVWTALTSTARVDAFVSPPTKPAGPAQAVPNPSWGYGKLDVDAAIDFLVPVRFLALDVAWGNDGPVIAWQLAESEPGAALRVERGAAEDGTFRAVSGNLDGSASGSWTDPSPDAAEPWYRVRVTTRDGGTSLFGPVRLEAVANRVTLLQNAPNPFAASTVLGFSLESAGQVRLEIVDVRGRRVALLEDGLRSAGRHDITWDATDDHGRRVPAGVYFYRLVTDGRLEVKRLVVTG